MLKTVLNLGCGNKHLSEAINVDCNARVHPDVVHDLNNRPWPFDDNSFAEVAAYDVIEHCADVIATMDLDPHPPREDACRHLPVMERAFA
jgi:hypothetical protein